MKPGTSATTAPAAGNPLASPALSTVSHFYDALKQYVAWPLVVAGAGWLFAVYAGVHILDYLGVSGWLAWKGVEAFWLTAAIAGYLALVLVEHETTQTAIKWTVWVMFLTGSLGYAWHDGASRKDGQLAYCEFRAAYDHAEAARLAAKYGAPMQLIIPTAIPSRDVTPNVTLPVVKPNVSRVSEPKKVTSRRVTRHVTAAASPFAN